MVVVVYLHVGHRGREGVARKQKLRDKLLIDSLDGPIRRKIFARAVLDDTVGCVVQLGTQTVVVYVEGLHAVTVFADVGGLGWGVLRGGLVGHDDDLVVGPMVLVVFVAVSFIVVFVVFVGLVVGLILVVLIILIVFIVLVVVVVVVVIVVEILELDGSWRGLVQLRQTRVDCG